MYFHNILIPRGAYFLLPLKSKQEATLGRNFTKCISEVKVNQLKVKRMHFEMGISIFNCDALRMMLIMYTPKTKYETPLVLTLNKSLFVQKIKDM